MFTTLHAFYSHHARKFKIVSPLELLIRQRSSLFSFLIFVSRVKIKLWSGKLCSHAFYLKHASNFKVFVMQESDKQAFHCFFWGEYQDSINK